MSYDDAIRMLKGCSIPWAIVNIYHSERIEVYDTPEQIAKCCSCCAARCTNCVAKKIEEAHKKYLATNKGGYAKKRDISMFVALKAQGLSRQQIIDSLGISNATYTRMNKQYKEESR